MVALEVRFPAHVRKPRFEVHSICNYRRSALPSFDEVNIVRSFPFPEARIRPRRQAPTALYPSFPSRTTGPTPSPALNHRGEGRRTGTNGKSLRLRAGPGPRNAMSTSTFFTKSCLCQTEKLITAKCW